MTREEQVDWLCRLRADLNNGVIFTPWTKEFSEALTNILEQEPTYYPPCTDCNKKMDEIRRTYDILKEQDPCDDVVSRQAVLDCATLITSIPTEDWDIGDWVCLFMDRVNKLPSVRPQPKMGHWIKYGVPRCGEQHYKCTSCGYYINFGQWGDLYTKEFKYCPNCGVKMMQESEVEE